MAARPERRIRHQAVTIRLRIGAANQQSEDGRSMRTFIEQANLTGLVRAHCRGRRLAGLERMAGSTSKGVYRLTFDDGTTLVLFAWRSAENYWPAGPDAAEDPFAGPTGAADFAASHAALTAAGVRVPRLQVIDQSQEYFPADVALVEDVRGGSLEDLMERDPAAAAEPLARLGSSIRAMHASRGAQFGKLAPLTVPEHSEAGRPEDVIARRALRHLEAAAAQVPRLAAAQPKVAALLAALRADIEPRREYALVHGELGPDHVLLDDSAQPVIIDIEGVTYFDVEWEHAFLRLRFWADYAGLGLAEVDEARVRFYDFAQRLSLIEGPLRIAATDYPDRDWMLDLAEYHTNVVLAAVAGS
jgi:aminoglycoside phosphotransferase (APT) family kinase protein